MRVKTIKKRTSIKTIPLPGFIPTIPKHLKVLLGSFAMVTLALFLVYVAVLDPMLSRAAVPSVSSSAASSIGQNSATLNGDITADGGSPVTEYGFEYGLTTSYGSTSSLPLNGGYQYQGQWGEFGFGNGQFLNPSSIGRDSVGNIYVVDGGNNRIQKFNSSGTYITQWGSNGTGDGQFDYPQDVAFDSSNNVYVVDSQNNRIQKFNSSGTYITKWGSNGTGDGQFDSPTAIALDSSNNVYVVDTNNSRIQKFNSSGTYITQWGVYGEENPGEFSYPSSITIDSNSYVYVGDYTNRVQKFTSSGVYQSTIGSIGSSDGQFGGNSIMDLGVDGASNLYVADPGLSRVQKFDSSGSYVAKFGSSGNGNGQFGTSFRMAVSPAGEVYVVDTFNNRVQNFADVATTGPIDSPVTALNCETTYHYRAFATNADGTSYGNDQTFITGTCASLGSSVSSSSASNIGRTTATLNGNTTDYGLKGVSVRGFEFGLTTGYGTTVNDTVSSGDSQTYEVNDLTCNTTYNFRAFATNSQGSAYGDNLTFTTSACLAAPTVTTNAASSVERYAVTLNGSTTNFASSEITSRGFEYGLTTSYGTTVTDTESEGNSQTKLISGLQCDTIYHYRAFATNEAGTGNGDDQTFTTADCRPDIDLQLTKSLSSAAPVQSGDTVTFRLELKNVGLQAISYDDYVGQFVDVLPQEFTISPTFTEQLNNDWIDCGYEGIGSSTENEYYQAVYPNNGIVSCMLVSGPLSLAVDETITFNITGTANANFVNGETQNSALFLPNTNVEEGFNAAVYAAVGANEDMFALDYNNVSNYIYSGTSDNQNPTVSVTAPTAGQSFSYGQTVNLTATSADADGSIVHLELFLDDVSIGSTANSANLTIQADGLPSGTHTVYAEATDNDGVTVTSSLITFTVATAAPVVTTSPSLDATQDTADFKGSVTSIGSSPLTARGFQYGLNTSYGQTISDDTSATGGFTLTAENLECATTYSYRAFASSAVGTVYGSNQAITTDACAGPPQLVETHRAQFARQTSVKLLGRGISDTVLGSGFEFGSTSSFGTVVQNGMVTNPFYGGFYDSSKTNIQADIYDLTCGTKYYFRAFMTNAYGTTYGDVNTFFTADCQTDAETESWNATNITPNSATVNTRILSGQEYITRQGVSLYKDGSQVLGGVEDLSRVDAYALAGQLTGDGDADGVLSGAQKIQSDDSNNIYVLVSSGDSIQKFDPEGNFERKITTPDFFSDMAVSKDGDIYTLTYDLNNDEYFIQRFNSNGIEQQELNIDSYLPFISGFGRGGAKIEVNRLNQILVSVVNHQDATAYTFSSSLTLVNQWSILVPGVQGTDVEDWIPESGQNYGLAIDNSNNVYIGVYENALNGGVRVAKFSSTGEYIDQGGDLRVRSGRLIYGPNWGDLAIDRNGSVWLGNWQFDQNMAIIRSDIRRDLRRYINLGGSISEDPIADEAAISYSYGDLHIDSNNNVYVAYNDTVTVFQRISPMETRSWNLYNLQCGTTYEYEAYIETSFDTFTAPRQSFTTSPCSKAPSVTTGVASGISATSGTMNGSVTSIGSGTLSARGFQYGATSSYGKTTNDFISATGSFSSVVSSLGCGTSIHYRAYATNAVGTGYGTDQLLTTSPCPGAPVVTTQAASAVGKVTATLNGTVVSPGTSAVTIRGFQYGLTTNFGNTYRDTTAGTGRFSQSISTQCGRNYYYRAFATSSIGTSYGNTVQFTTGICELPPKVTITSPTNNQVFGATVTSVELSSTAVSPTNKIVKVEFYVDGKLVGTADKEPYTVTALGLPVGQHTLLARAFDVLGVSSDAQPVKFFVDPASVATVSANNKNTKNGVGFKYNPERRNWLDVVFGHRLFRWLPLFLILLILITAAYYGRHSYREYILRMRVQRSLRRYADTLRTTNDFLAISTHFLNTPVAILNGSVELLAAQKVATANTIKHLSTRVKAFADSVQEIMISNQSSATAQSDVNSKLQPKLANPLKDKAVWIPLTVMFVLLVIANGLLIYVNVLTNSLARMGIELGLFVLAGGLLVLSRRYKDLLIATRKIAQEQLAKEALFLKERRNFISSTHTILQQHLEGLELAGQSVKSVPQAKLYFNGVAMLASLQRSLQIIENTTDMDADAPLFAVSAYIRKLNKDFAAQAKEKGVTFTAEAADGISVRIQPQNFTQLVTSVVDNALRFTQEGGAINVTARRRFGKIVVTVNDTGIGISKERLHELFQPFARATDTMQFDYDGAGLSLYVDKVIMTRLGGTITIASTEGRGTTVTMNFPAPGREESLLTPTTITPNVQPGMITPST